MPDIQIFIADDDQDDRGFIREAVFILAPYISTVEAVNGLDLLEKIKSYGIEDGFAIILLDMNMPLLDGLDTAKQ